LGRWVSCRVCWAITDTTLKITQNINALPLKYLNTDNSRTTAMQTKTRIWGARSKVRLHKSSGSVCDERSLCIQTQVARSRAGNCCFRFEFGTINARTTTARAGITSGQFTLASGSRKAMTYNSLTPDQSGSRPVEYLNAADPLPKRANRRPERA